MGAIEQSIIYSRLVALDPRLVTPPEILLTEATCLVGRSSECHVVVSDALVSRRHAQIEQRSGHYLLRDLGSVNGTYINGQRLLGAHALRNEDRIGLGALTAVLRFVDPDATQIAAGVLRFDERGQVFFLRGAPLNLPPLQFLLLLHLYQHAGQICSRSSCAQAIWGREYNPEIDQGALDTAFSDLRRAMRQTAPGADLIETRRGLGYLLRL